MSNSHIKLAQVDPPFDVSIYVGKTDVMGLGWMIDSDNNLIHHGGNTGYSNSFLGFDKAKRIAVVVLVNMPGQQSRIIGSEILRELWR